MKRDDLFSLQTKLGAGYSSLNGYGSGWDESIGSGLVHAFNLLKTDGYKKQKYCSNSPYCNGVLSGWRNTISINSFINTALMRSFVPVGATCYVAGDDNTMITSTPLRKEDMTNAYEKSGFILNNNKIYTAFRGTTEFLKTFITPVRIRLPSAGSAGYSIRFQD